MSLPLAARLKERKLNQPETARRIRERRIARGLTQTALAEFLEISNAYLCDLEAGKRDWSEELIAAAERRLQ